MSRILILLGVFFLFIQGCSSQDLRCVDVDYYNSNTSSQSSYRLTAEVVSNELVRLNFPSGGYLDKEDFGYIVFESRIAIVSLQGGKTYKVKLLSQVGDCFDNVLRTSQCKGITKKGKRCKTQTDSINGRCWQH